MKAFKKKFRRARGALAILMLVSLVTSCSKGTTEDLGGAGAAPTPAGEVPKPQVDTVIADLTSDLSGPNKTIMGSNSSDVVAVITGGGYINLENNGAHVAATQTGTGVINIINNGQVMTATNTGSGVMTIHSNATGAVTVTRTGNGRTIIFATGSSVITLTYTSDDDVSYGSPENVWPALSDCANTTNLVAGATMSNVCTSSAFTTGANSTVNGYVRTLAAVTLGENSQINGFVTTGTAFASGDSSVVRGPVIAGTVYTSGANSTVNGNVTVSGDVTLGANSHITGSVYSGTGVITYGAGATVGNVSWVNLAICQNTTNLVAGGSMSGVCSSAAFTSGAGSTVNGNVSTLTTVVLGANSRVTGSVSAGAAFTSGDSSVINGNVYSNGDVTLGVNSRIIGSVHSRTGVINYGAGSSVGSVQ